MKVRTWIANGITYRGIAFGVQISRSLLLKLYFFGSATCKCLDDNYHTNNGSGMIVHTPSTVKLVSVVY